MVLTSEQQKIVTDNIGLVGSFINKYRPPLFIRMADYESELMLALCRAVLTWNPNGGAALSTWSYHKFMGARSDIIRRNAKFFRNEKQISEERYLEVEGPKFDPCDVFELTEYQLDNLRDRVDALDDMDKLLISQDHTSREISDIIGISMQHVHHKRRVLLRKLAFRLKQVFPKQFRRDHAMGNGGLSVPDNPHGT